MFDCKRKILRQISMLEEKKYYNKIKIFVQSTALYDPIRKHIYIYIQFVSIYPMKK